MDSEFTEFSYGFALTYNIVEISPFPILAAPQFPSLIQEGQQGGGYDVTLDFGFFTFLQFKLTEFMIGAQAGERAWMGGNYYRFWLMPRWRSQQHNMLCQLEASGEDVFYAAPSFYQTAAFNNAFTAQAVVENSIFVSPLEIGEIEDDDDHRVVFNDEVAYFSSKPRKIKKSSGHNFLRSLHRQRKPKRTTEVARSMMAIAQRHGLEVPNLRSETPGGVLPFISHCAHAFFHSEVLFRPNET